MKLITPSLLKILVIALCLFLVIFPIGCTEKTTGTDDDSTLQTTIVRDIDFKRRTIYDLGRLQMPRCRSDTLPEPEKYDFIFGDSIEKLIAYVDDGTGDNYLIPGVCFVDPTDTTSDDPSGEYRTEGYFEVVNDADYWFHPARFYIQFFRLTIVPDDQPMIGPDDVLAVYMEVKRAGGEIDTIGNISSTPFRLKLIKPRHYADINNHVWEYEWRNVYGLGQTNIDLNSIHIGIYKGNLLINHGPDPDDPNHQEGIPFIEILGLDQGDDNGAGQPDGRVDGRVYIDTWLGLLFFPVRHPFDSRVSFVTDQQGDSVYLNDPVPGVYRDTSDILIPASKYYLKILQ
jgi:hypothetical protein